MSMDEVLAIGDVFLVHGRGLVLVPIEFRSVLPSMKFQRIDATIKIVQPDGTQTQFDAVFSIEHFSFADGESLSLVALIPSASREDVPHGSGLVLEKGTLSLLRGLVNVL